MNYPGSLISGERSLLARRPSESGDQTLLFDPTAATAEIVRNWFLESAQNCLATADKTAIRNAHLPHRREVLARATPFLLEHGRDLLHWFAVGSEIRAEGIRPQILPVDQDNEYARLFRLASLWWSVPVSHGFGRRQRFLVLDKSNSKLIGIFALGDPVFNLGPRDQAIRWTARDRELRLKYIIDAFVLGAMPPYSSLLCGKLIAALATSRETEEAFCSRYKGLETVIRKKRENARLAALTTSSVYGRSSVYDRLRVNDRLGYTFVGKTKGYGHFHVPTEVFRAMVRVLDHEKHPYAHGNRFGNGPNWKMRVIRVALKLLGLDATRLNHGFQRGVYVAPLASNSEEFLRGEQRVLRKDNQSTSGDIIETMRARWIIPRSIRNRTWREINGADLIQSSINSIIGTKVL